MKGLYTIQRNISFVLILVLLICLSGKTGAQTTEYELKAAFIYNIAKFVEWIDHSTAERLDILPLCILGDDPFGKAIDKLEGKKIQDFTLQVHRINALDNDTGCQILFISQSMTDTIKILLDDLKHNKGILTISDIEGFANNGGIIELVIRDNRVQFIANIASARNADIHLSSKILRLANVVGGNWGDN
jgi:hypothetical protein